MYMLKFAHLYVHSTYYLRIPSLGQPYFNGLVNVSAGINCPAVGAIDYDQWISHKNNYILYTVTSTLSIHKLLEFRWRPVYNSFFIPTLKISFDAHWSVTSYYTYDDIYV
jgi:hypothetical protein